MRLKKFFVFNIRLYLFGLLQCVFAQTSTESRALFRNMVVLNVSYGYSQSFKQPMSSSLTRTGLNFGKLKNKYQEQAVVALQRKLVKEKSFDVNKLESKYERNQRLDSVLLGSGDGKAVFNLENVHFFSLRSWALLNTYNKFAS